ncbi:hypothetical protein B0T10DRAFT_462449 [Thelonectria olida]|uniref:LysM domain-containing protein n=1 Tax=Thelonectria olida TaxID=1576542 RepID=A0A9P8W2I9_9HYPO|nr:hypothetical protein B0T10DRAFT_462449 [Thelonectria olida]
MAFFQNPFFSALALALVFNVAAAAEDNVQLEPYRWQDNINNRCRGGQVSTVSGSAQPSFTPSVPKKDIYKPGDVKCSCWGGMYDDCNSDSTSCEGLAQHYGIDVGTFFKLNPILDPDCKDIKPYTLYCIDGTIEPLRAHDGLCGPEHNDATCLGTGKECCNSETWTCGNSEEDCSPGICYESACPGHKVYTTDGKCYEPGRWLRACAGKWGECCRVEGECGNGPSYCGQGNCVYGKCTDQEILTPVVMPMGSAMGLPDELLFSISPDGTCGGQEGWICGSLYAKCCNKHGYGGSLPEDCGSALHNGGTDGTEFSDRGLRSLCNL